MQQIINERHTARPQGSQYNGRIRTYRRRLLLERLVAIRVDIKFWAPHAINATASVAASTQWRGDSTPSTRRRPRDRVGTQVTRAVDPRRDPDPRRSCARNVKGHEGGPEEHEARRRQRRGLLFVGEGLVFEELFARRC